MLLSGLKAGNHNVDQTSEEYVRALKRNVRLGIAHV